MPASPHLPPLSPVQDERLEARMRMLGSSASVFGTGTPLGLDAGVEGGLA